MTSSSATLTVTEQDPLHRIYVLDCEHARTSIDYLIPPVGSMLTEHQILAMLQARHRESCACGWRIVRGGAV
jgi:hypothetical protein